jgi:hypothetical protein
MSIQWRFTSNAPLANVMMRAACAAAITQSARAAVVDAGSRVPVDTSGLQNSFYVVDESSSGYANAEGEVLIQGATGGVRSDPKDLTPHLTRPARVTGSRPNVIEAVVASVVDYAEPVELGHVRDNGSYAAPRPSLGPAGDEQIEPLKNNLAREMRRRFG